MTLTVLAVVFLVLLLTVFVVGQKLLSQKTEALQDSTRDQCTICRNTFQKSDMIERQVGDFKIMYFCRGCIESLYGDLSREKRLPVSRA